MTLIRWRGARRELEWTLGAWAGPTIAEMAAFSRVSRRRSGLGITSELVDEGYNSS
jgi:hypothetical protein